MDVPVEPAAEAAEAAVAEGEREAKRPRLEPCAPRLGKKRKVVIFLGYVGAGYAGMQRNPGVRSIEDALEQALHAAGGISDDNMGALKKIDWSRAARTDKGLVIDPPGVLERINEALPANFRAYSVTRVTNGFSAKNMCDRRRYRYVLPEWALHASASCEADAAALPPMPDATLAQLNALLARFVGTHSFHNFTPRCAAGDRSALRYILSCSAMPARTVHGLRVVTLEVLGQSFMLHQIRKMVGATLCIIRGVLPVDFLDRALLKSSQPIFTPMAPDLGLYLCECIFGAYNERWAGSHEQLSLAGCGDAPAEFERQKVLGHIVATEQREGVFAAWLRELLEHRGAAPEETAGGDDDGGEDEEAHDSETRGGGRGRGRQGQRSRATDVEKDVRSPPAAAAAVSDAG